MSNSNGTLSTVVVQVKPMGMQEKGRIEKLIDTRAGALRTYLGEMKDFAYRANDSTEFAKTEEVTETKKSLAQIAIDRERIDGARQGEVDAVNQVLSDQLEKKLARVKELERRVTQKHHEEEQAASDEIHAKFRDQEDTLIGRETELKLHLEALEKAESREKLIRKIALANSFARLEDGISDTRNLAVERLYTEVVKHDDARVALALLPDATQFRDRVSPERLFQVFNDRIEQKTLPLEKAVCNKCGSEKIQTHDRGEVYCRECGKYDVLDASVKKLVALPSIQEIAEDSRPDVPKSTPETTHTGGLRESLGVSE